MRAISITCPCAETSRITISRSSLTDSYIVSYVVDGDTIDVQVNGETKRIRLIGIDAPETRHPEKKIEPYGPEASAFAKRLLLGQQVKLKFRRKNIWELDRYGRVLAYVYLCPDELLVNLEMIRRGLAKATCSDGHPLQDLFIFAEKTAQRMKEGQFSGIKEIAIKLNTPTARRDKRPTREEKLDQRQKILDKQKHELREWEKQLDERLEKIENKEYKLGIDSRKRS